MKYYRLKTNFKENKEWQAILPPIENQALQITAKLGRQERLDINRSINMGLYNRQSDDAQKKETPFKADLIYWRDDITLGVTKPELGAYVIISSKLKVILEQFSLPRHKFYKVNLYCAEIQKSSMDFYLLFIYGYISNHTNFKKSEYTYSDLKTYEILKKEYGAFNEKLSFSNKMKDFLRNKDILIKITRRFFTVDYDIMWGIANQLWVNEKVKEVIENNNLYGVELSVFKDFEIVPSSEYEL